jgi:MHS family proline/betaine transporter-like MFS transporter
MDKNRLFPLIGNILEVYEYYLYGYLLSTVFAPLFFQEKNNDSFSLLMSLMVFISGLVVRPIGGLIFGHIGDRYGRRISLLLSSSLLTATTIVMSIIPTYKQIGFSAVVILIIVRVIAGISASGETSSIIVFIAEHVLKKNVNFWVNVMFCFGQIGLLMINCVMFILIYFMGENFVFNSGGWRILFLLGGVVGLFIIKIRNHMTETPDFLSLSKRKIAKIPIIKMIRFHRTSRVCLLVIINCIEPSLVYMLFIFNNIWLETYTKTNINDITLINVTGIIIYSISCLLGGFMADKNLRFFCTIFSLLFGSLIVFLGYNMLKSEPIYVQILGQVLLCGVYGIIGLGNQLFTISQIPIQYRSSGLSFYYNTGYMFSAVAMSLIVGIIILTNNIMIPAYYLLSLSLLSLFAYVIYNKFFLLNDNALNI